MNVQPKINKLLMAIRMKAGRIYKINTSQYYNQEKDKVVTRYTVFESHPKSDGVDFYSRIDLLKHLVKEYKWLTGGEIDEDDG